MSKIAVIGGGISGLCASLFAKLKYPNSNIILLESTERFGGWIHSRRYLDGSIHELGPRTIRTASESFPFLIKIFREINVGKVVNVDKQILNHRFIFVKNKLHPLKFSLWKSNKPFNHSLFSLLLKASSRNFEHERNLKDFPLDYFVRTRFGHEIADYVLNPVIRGIYACDPKDLSVQATFPFLLDWEKDGSNVVRGALKQMLRQQSMSLFHREKKSNNQDMFKDGELISFAGGMETLIDEIKEKLNNVGVEMHLNSCVVKVKKCLQKPKYALQLSDRVIECDAVIVATPSYVAANQLYGIIPDIDLLQNIHWNSIAVVVLEYDGCPVMRPGFGHLIPSSEIPHVLGVVYDSCILPQLDSTALSTSRYSVMLGGSWFSKIEGLNTNELCKIAQDTVTNQLGVNRVLRRFTVAVNHHSIPIYGLKHLKLVTTIDNALISNGLAIRLCGNSYYGVSVTDCVRSAYNSIQSLPDIL